MTKPGYTRYWIMVDVGDPLPTIGSGFRGVDAKVGPKYVLVLGETAEQNVHIDRRVWDGIPHVEDTRQPLIEALTALRRYQPPKPCKAKETCE